MQSVACMAGANHPGGAHMTDSASHNPRLNLLREAVVLQLKLLVDGLRDAILIPISLLAAVIGLLRGGPDCDREYRRVLKLGRRSERWIDLFGNQRPLGKSGTAGSLDSILEQVESTMLEQYAKSRKPGQSAPPEGDDQKPNEG
jgi:hypothetical protein